MVGSRCINPHRSWLDSFPRVAGGEKASGGDDASFVADGPSALRWVLRRTEVSVTASCQTGGSWHLEQVVQLEGPGVYPGPCCPRRRRDAWHPPNGIATGIIVWAEGGSGATGSSPRSAPLSGPIIPGVARGWQQSIPSVRSSAWPERLCPHRVRP